MPAALFARRRACGPSRHPSEPDPLFYHVKELTVRHLLGSRQTHIRCGWKQPFAHLGIAAAVVAVARGAVIREVLQAFALDLRRSRHGVRAVSFGGRNGPLPDRSRERDFNAAGRRPGAQAGGAHIHPAASHREHNNDGDADERAFHRL